MVIKRLCFACTKSGKIVRFVLKNCTFRFRDYTKICFDCAFYVAF